MATQLSSGRTPLPPFPLLPLGIGAPHILSLERPGLSPGVGHGLVTSCPPGDLAHGCLISWVLTLEFHALRFRFAQDSSHRTTCDVFSLPAPLPPPQPHPPAHSLCPPGIWDLTPGLPALGRDCLWASQCPKTAGVPGVRAALSWVFCRPSAPAPVRVVNRGISLTHLKEATVGTGSS